MGSIENYNFSDFTQAIKNQIGEKAAGRLENKAKNLESIFMAAAANDHGTQEQLDTLQDDADGFKALVKRGIAALRQMYVLGQSNTEDVIEGDYAVKNTDTYEYKNNMWVKVNTNYPKSADELVAEREEKAEIKRQYPYYTDADVNARYEIEHMEYRSAELMEELHSGTSPAEVLQNYKEKLTKIKDRTFTGYFKPDKGDGATITEKYDEYGRIISKVTKFDTEANGENTSTYEYNPDGSYTVTSIEDNGKRKYVYQYDAHGKLSTKYEGDYM